MKIKRKSSQKDLSGVFLSLVLVLFLYASVTSGAGGSSNNSVNIKDGLMNAELHSVPLKNVLQNIKLSNNLEYKGDEDVLSEKITVSFNSLSIESGFKRILSKFNYSITYNSDETPASIYIFGKKGDSAGNIRTTIADRSPQIMDRDNKIEDQQASAVEKKESR